MMRSLRIAPVTLLAFALGACSGGPGGPTGAIASAPPTAASTATPSTAAPTVIPVPTDTPLGDRLVATITVPQAPCAMAVDATSVWISGSATAELVRIDPTTNAVTGKVALEGGPCGVAVGPDGRIWLAELGKGAVVAVDPATMKVTGRLDGVGPQLWDLKAGLGSIWVADRSAKALLRIDPKDASISATA